MHLIVTAAVIAVLIVVNLLNNKWATKHYLMICFIATASLIAIARVSGIYSRGSHVFGDSVKTEGSSLGEGVTIKGGSLDLG